MLGVVQCCCNIKYNNKGDMRMMRTIRNTYTKEEKRAIEQVIEAFEFEKRIRMNHLKEPYCVVIWVEQLRYYFLLYNPDTVPYQNITIVPIPSAEALVQLYLEEIERQILDEFRTAVASNGALPVLLRSYQQLSRDRIDHYKQCLPERYHDIAETVYQNSIAQYEPYNNM